MNVIIRIDYIAVDINNRAYRAGKFPLKGRSQEQVAYEFWKWIKREIPIELELEKVTIDGDRDITELVKKIEKAPLK